ncbi:Ribonuclease [compost metagenome]
MKNAPAVAAAKQIAANHIEAVSGVRDGTVSQMPDGSKGETARIVRNAEVLAADEKTVLVRQNPVTGEYEAVGGNLANSGAKGTGADVDNAAHNVAKFSQMKLDLKTTESTNTIVDSLRKTGQLPDYYVNKTQAAEQGWQPGKALSNSVPNGQIGGNVFHNTTNVLPSAPGRTWFEADIGINNIMSRSNQAGTRLLYSNDGLLYITTDHYKSVAPIGTWK